MALADILAGGDSRGDGGEIERKLRAKVALGLMQQGTSAAPVQHWTQGLARVAQALSGGVMAGQIGAEEGADEAQSRAARMNLPGLSPVAASLSAPGGVTPASIRTNNPGAQYPGPVSSSFGSPGFDTIGGGHKIAKFNTPEEGGAAQFALLGKNYVGMPLSTAINKWSGGNSAPQYTQFVTQQTGLSPDTVITPELLQSPQGVALVKAMSQHEAGRPYPMTDQQWGDAQRRAFAQNTFSRPPVTGTSATITTPQIDQGTARYIQGLLGSPKKTDQAEGRRLYEHFLTKSKDQVVQKIDENGTPYQEVVTTGERKADPTKSPAIIETEYARNNWQKLGLPDPNATDKESRDFWQQQSAKRLGGAGNNISFSTEKKGQEELASKGIAAYTDAQMAGRESQKRIAVYDRMEKAAESFKPGASAEIRLAGQRWLKELGITSSENVPEGEVLKMLGQQLAIHAQPKGQGAVSNFEREMFAKSLPNMTQSPEGLRKAIDISRSLEKFDADTARIYRDSARKNKGIPNYLEVQDEIANLGSPLSDNQMATIKGTEGGAAATGGVRRYNPATGKIE